MHQHTKILLKSVQMRSIFQIKIRHHVEFFKQAKFYLKRTGGLKYVTMPNLVEIRPSIAEIFFDFSRWRPSAILDLFGAYLNHTCRVLGAKLGVSISLCKIWL